MRRTNFALSISAAVLFHSLGLAMSLCTEERATQGEAQSSAQVSKTIQGWDDRTRMLFYHTPQGSRMMPYQWFMALDSLDGKSRFPDNSNLARYGFIPSPYSGKLNPDGLPIGFAIDQTFQIGKKMETVRAPDPLKHDGFDSYIGLTCGGMSYIGSNYRGQTKGFGWCSCTIGF